MEITKISIGSTFNWTTRGGDIRLIFKFKGIHYMGYSSDIFATKQEAEEALKKHNDGTNIYKSKVGETFTAPFWLYRNK